MRRALIAVTLALGLAGAAQAERAPAGVNMRVVLAERPAATLSAYRLFRDPGAMSPSAGVVRYDLATPLFSDYALKQRYVFVPPGQRARYRAGATFDFPVGAVLVKTFAFPADLRRPDEIVRALETRLLIRKTDGWTALAYVWDADGREARLQLAGAQIPVRAIGAEGRPLEIAYAVPNKNQCKGCHSVADALAPIGPTARNLDRAMDGANQLAHWVAAGVLDAAPPSLPANTSLDARARAYLDVNCAHCHNPLGPASNSGLDLSVAQSDPALWGVRKRPVAAGRASAGLLFSIDPGHPERSILLHRMQSTDPGVMMPELGRTLVHREGVALIRDWIAAMNANGRVIEPN